MHVEQNSSSYRERNGLILKLGFASYADYLASPLWATVKSEVYSTYGDVCFLCPRKASVVHHHKYTLRNLNGRSVRALYPLCNQCHEHIEIKPDGTKRMLWEVKTFFNNLKKQFPSKSAKRKREQKKRKRLLGRI